MEPKPELNAYKVGDRKLPVQNDPPIKIYYWKRSFVLWGKFLEFEFKFRSGPKNKIDFAADSDRISYRNSPPFYRPDSDPVLSRNELEFTGGSVDEYAARRMKEFSGEFDREFDPGFVPRTLVDLEVERTVKKMDRMMRDLPAE